MIDAAISSLVALVQTNIGDKIIENSLWLIIGNIITFLLTLVAVVAIGKRFINNEYPGFVSRVEGSIKNLETKVSGDITDIRKDVVGLREQLVEKSLQDVRYQERLGRLEEVNRELRDRLGFLERSDRGDDTGSFRRRKLD